MPQVLKDEIRQRLLAAALEVFAERGWEGASMAAIAERAGVGTATTYRYFTGKDELFDAVVTPAIATRFEALLEERVHALADVALEGAAGDDRGEAMIRFWMENRLAVVVLLDRAAGTRYAGYGERFVDLLVAGTVAAVRRRRRGLRLTAPQKLVLRQIFEGTRRTLAAILAAHADPASLTEAIEAFWSYQIPGLQGFARRLLGEA